MQLISRPPTRRQLDVLEFVAAHLGSAGYPPTLREICDHFGWSSLVSASNHLAALERRSLIERKPEISRGLRITEKGRSLCQV